MGAFAKKPLELQRIAATSTISLPTVGEEIGPGYGVSGKRDEASETSSIEPFSGWIQIHATAAGGSPRGERIVQGRIS